MMVQLGGYTANPVCENLTTRAGTHHIVAGDQSNRSVTSGERYQLSIDTGSKLVQMYDTVLTSTGSGRRNQPVAPQQNVPIVGVPSAQGKHILCTVLCRQNNTGKALIRCGLHELLRFGGAYNSDLIAEVTGCTGDV